MTNAELLSRVDRVYSGKAGCMCGCLGKYSDPSTRGGKTIFNRVMNDPDRKVEGDIIYTEKDGRIRAVYFKRQW